MSFSEQVFRYILIDDLPYLGKVLKVSRKVTLAGETICEELYLLSQKESDQQTTLFAVGMQNDNKSW
jgi:hypothetical protein